MAGAARARAERSDEDARSTTRVMHRAAVAAIAILLTFPLVAHASVGWFARYVADDYCWAGILRTQGFVQAQVHWYTAYSPRYAFTFIVNLVELVGPGIVPFLPIAAIAVWLAVMTWTVAQFELGFTSRVATLLVAQATLVATLQTAPDVQQSLYWQTGMLTYVLPLILATFLMGWIRRSCSSQHVHAGTLSVSMAVPFVAGGLSETYLIPQNVALTLAFLAAVAARQRTLAVHIGAAWLGGVLALATIVLAPSTGSRVGGPPADLVLAASASIATAAFQVVWLVRYFPLAIALCLLLPSVLVWLGTGTRERRHDWRGLGVVAAAVLITLPFCYFPSFYAQNGNPPARSLIVPGAILIGFLTYAGFVLRGSLGGPRPIVMALVCMSLAIGPLASTAETLSQRAAAAEYAARWDAEDQRIRAAQATGVRDLIVQPLPRYLGEAYVTPDPNDWFNACVARFYGLDSIATAG